MDFLIWLFVGGAIGWLASMWMRTPDPQSVFRNVGVGVVGAMLGGWFIAPLTGVGTIDQGNFSLPDLIVSFLGAAILLAVVNAFPRGRAVEGLPPVPLPQQSVPIMNPSNLSLDEEANRVPLTDAPEGAVASTDVEGWTTSHSASRLNWPRASHAARDAWNRISPANRSRT